MTDVPRVGVGVLVRDDLGRLLLIHRRGAHGGGTWSSPGGHLDHGEGFAECAIREAREETGVEINDVRFHAVTNDVLRETGRHYVTIRMDATYAGGDVRVASSRELTEVGWFDPNDLPEPLFLPLRTCSADETLD